VVDVVPEVGVTERLPPKGGVFNSTVKLAEAPEVEEVDAVEVADRVKVYKIPADSA
jgi:hypothetical protein